MSPIIRAADSKGCVRLPGFASATVIIEPMGDSKYRLTPRRHAGADF